jgi:prepilin-type N-terminal cleavage/methylation domain-containing protein
VESKLGFFGTFQRLLKNRRCIMLRKGRFGDQRGFTLIEIIAVLVILAVLAVVAVPKYMNLIQDSKNKAATGAVAEGMGRVSQAVASYMLTHNGSAPVASNITAILTGSAYLSSGDFTLAYGAVGTTAVSVGVTGVAGNASGGTASGVVALPQ